MKIMYFVGMNPNKSTQKPDEKKPTLELWDTVGTGLIISYESGVLYSNQVGGTACLHPVYEGIFVPFHNDYTQKELTFMSPELALNQHFEGYKYGGAGAGPDGIDSETADFIDGVLKKYGHDRWLRVDRSKLRQSDEAWIYVEILQDEGELVKNFGPYPREGILTWCNSD